MIIEAVGTILKKLTNGVKNFSNQLNSPDNIPKIRAKIKESKIAKKLIPRLMPIDLYISDVPNISRALINEEVNVGNTKGSFIIRLEICQMAKKTIMPNMIYIVFFNV